LPSSSSWSEKFVSVPARAFLARLSTRAKFRRTSLQTRNLMSSRLNLAPLTRAVMAGAQELVFTIDTISLLRSRVHLNRLLLNVQFMFSEYAALIRTRSRWRSSTLESTRLRSRSLRSSRKSTPVATDRSSSPNSSTWSARFVSARSMFWARLSARTRCRRTSLRTQNLPSSRLNSATMTRAATEGLSFSDEVVASHHAANSFCLEYLLQYSYVYYS
jgi:hypothetical protein